MKTAAMIVGAVSVLSWTYLLLLRGRFWQVSRTIPPFAPTPGAQDGAPAKAQDGAPAKIVGVVPARNEAEVIRRAITSLLTQEAMIHVILVDDNSTDGTAEIARETARHLNKAEALTVISGRSLPPGWSGKLWAVQQGIEVAQQLAPDYLLPTDADIEHAPGAVQSLVTLARDGGYDLASLMVKLHCRSTAEKLLIPAFVFFFFMLYPPAWIRDPSRKTAGAAGGCVLITPEALARAGGIEAIRSEIIDDCALARQVKQSGGSVYLGLAQQTCSLRAYGSFAEIGRMIARTAFNQLHHSTLLLLLSLAGLAVVYLAPVALLFSGTVVCTGVALVALAMMITAYLPIVRFYGLSAAWAATLPAAALYYMGATLRSAMNYWLRRGGQWKGRLQDVKRIG